MIDRRYLRCTTCGKEIMIRTAIGHGDYQEFAMPCPECDIEIRYGMELDQKNVSFSYVKIINAEWIHPKSEPATVRVFDPETVIPLQLISEEIGRFVSPFIYTAHLPQDADKFHEDRVLRITLCREVWPIIRKCKIHFDNQRWDLFGIAFKEIYDDYEPGYPEKNIMCFLKILDRFGEAFRPYSDSKSWLIRQRINLAESIDSALCDDLRAYLRSIGWHDSLFTEMFSLKDRWAETVYSIIQPLYMTFYWDSKTNSILDYTLSQKRFDELKTYFIDAYETLCRISLLACAFECIIHHRRLKVHTGKKLIELEKYRGMDNGTKSNIVTKMVVSDIFHNMSDNRLRNGIGHYSAHYDVKTDTIRYRSESKKSVKHSAMRYIEFCKKIAELYYFFELASVYIHWLVAREYGLKGKVV